MAKKHLDRSPHNISDNLWWYEENGGICLCIKISSTKTRTEHIRWSSLRAALKRKDKK